MDDFEASHPLCIDLVYADGHHAENIFKTDIYRRGARLWLHREFAQIVLRAAQIIHEKYQGILILKDGLRTMEAQQAMQETEIVKANPQWSAPGPQRLLSPPGGGGHPRGMAVDVTVADQDGVEWDMGTPFDYLTTDPGHNPAARSYKGFSSHILENRRRLQDAFMQAGRELGCDVLPLPSEWWDFRFPASYTDQFAPLSDRDLPTPMRMVLN